MCLPQHAIDVEHCADEDNNHGVEEQNEENDHSPRMARCDRTHSVYRSTADVTRIGAHVTNTAAVAVFLNRQNQTTWQL